MATGAQPSMAQDLRPLSVSPDEPNAAVIEEVSGDLVEAMNHRVSTSRQAMVILAVRFRDEVSGSESQPIEAIGRRVLEKVICPILIVPPDRDMTTWRLRRELLPQDGTPGCAAALAQVINHSRQMGIENIVLRVAGAKVSQPRYVDHPQYEWEAWSREFLERIVGMGANLNAAGLRLLMATGEPAAEILRVVKEEAADMIIMPWHGTLDSGRARMIKAVLHGASCPVLLVPERGNQVPANLPVRKSDVNKC
jgi:nucleotide-binding universal stress UspA family protein